MARKVVMATATSGVKIDLQALNLIRRYQPLVLKEPSAFDVERFFENDLYPLTGVNFDYRTMSFDVLGYTDSDEMVSAVSSSLADDPSCLNPFRATVAHEIGHAFLHVPQFRRRKQLLTFVNDATEPRLRMFREDEIPLYQNPEWQAWRFAKALLMPAPTVFMAVNAGFSLIDICTAFSVSRSFALSRLKELRLNI
jgi:hypothetical protein